MATVAAAIAGGVAASAYLNAKYHLGRELDIIRKLKGTEKEWARRQSIKKVSPWYILEETCTKQPSARAVWTRDGEITYAQFANAVAQYANWLLQQGVRPGEMVAMYLHNSAEFYIIFFAIHCIGAAPALINYNLEGKALMHCLDVCKAKLIIIDTDRSCQTRINGSRKEIDAAGTRIVTLSPQLKSEIAGLSTDRPPNHYRDNVEGSDPYCLIYTSGTTGLPKGCPFTIGRTHLLGSHIYPPFDAQAGKDCWYSPMPLYHGTGLITTTVQLMAGVGCAITPRFSVSNFWSDIYDSGSTFTIYVGETARYLLNAPPHPLERKHNLRLAYGNGLRPDVWKKFQDRFNIPEITEFFNSSEGMFTLAVWDRGDYLRGCVGHHGLIFRRLLQNVYIPVQIDHDTGDIWRDPKTGFAKRVPYETGGEMLVAVKSKTDFGGYWNNESATNKKFASDVFKKGDLYYRSGDALRRTADGHWYFMDRLGDTFRWKSENVSTAEVAEALGRYPGITEANVYGVAVPNHEGRAGCAAIHLDDSMASKLDTAELLKYSQRQLPRYAVPLFIRIVKASSHIHNHKQNKVPLRKEGVDPDLMGTEEVNGKDDTILWLSPKNPTTYTPFTKQDWDDLTRAQVRL